MRLANKFDQDVVGTIRIQKYDLDGKLVSDEEDKNLVLDGSTRIFRDLMVGNLDAMISVMAFGDMGLTENDDLVNVPPAQPDDEGLINEIGTRPVTYTIEDIDGDPSIVYTTTIDYQDLNGSGTQIITEYSLMTVDGRAFNKKNRSAIIKTSEFRYVITWTLKFVK